MNDAIDRILNRGTADIVVREDLEKKLQSGKKLRIKLGIDPTKPDLHLGHAVPLRKLKQFQDAGHQIVLLFGGFTATIGDPTGKDEARPPLTLDEVEANAKDYIAHASKILDMDQVEIVNNRDWLEDLSIKDLIAMAAQFSASQMFERDMFQERLKKGKPVYVHEFLYPLLVAYDSVAIKADVEIGGTDQYFNLLQGRPMQKYFGQPEQNVLTVPLIEGTDGHEKMSKSMNNYVSLDEEPKEMFGKIMSIPDELMAKYFEVLTDEDLDEMNQLIGQNPRNAKVHLAKVLIAQFHDEAAADMAEQDFVTKFVKKDVPDEMPEFLVTESEIGLLTLMTQVAGFASSNGEARRMVQGGGVSIDGEKMTAPQANVTIKDGMVLKVGKRKFGRLRVG